MQIPLVNTNRIKPALAPIGLDYLADPLAAGDTLSLLDLCFSEEYEKDIEAAVTALLTELVGASVRNTDDCVYPSGAFLLSEPRGTASALRDHTDAPIVVGGVGFSTLPEAAMDYCGADFGIAGEGEDAMPRLARDLQTGSDLAQVPGLLWWDEGRIRRNRGCRAAPGYAAPPGALLHRQPPLLRRGRAGGVRDQARLPDALHLLRRPGVQGAAQPASAAAHGGGGAAGAAGAGHRSRARLRLRVQPARGHARAVCQAIIDEGLAERIRWYAYCSVAPFDAELALLFRRAGCAGIDFGADSGSEQMLKRLGRAFTPEDLAVTAKSCADPGIPSCTTFCWGGRGKRPRPCATPSTWYVGWAPTALGYRSASGCTRERHLRQRCAQRGRWRATPPCRARGSTTSSSSGRCSTCPPSWGAISPLPCRTLVGHDERFFLPGDYNYNDNARITAAIARGERGAYWDILRRQKRPA